MSDTKTLADIVRYVRSKNAGPFWLTIDIFCASQENYAWLKEHLQIQDVARLYRQAPEDIKRFAIDDLQVIKFSFPRPVVQGSRLDRDMHGAQWAVLLAELDLASLSLSK